MENKGYTRREFFSIPAKIAAAYGLSKIVGCATPKLTGRDFNALELNLVLTGVDTKEYNNVPANIGATRRVFMGTGNKYQMFFDDKEKKELVSKATPYWKPLPVTEGTVDEGGARVQGLEYVALKIDKKTADDILRNAVGRDEPGQKQVTPELWATLSNGKTEDGEATRYWVIATIPSGYTPRKPDEKKKPAEEKKAEKK